MLSSDHFYLLVYMRKRAEFYVTNAFDEKLAPQILCGKEKM